MSTRSLLPLLAVSLIAGCGTKAPSITGVTVTVTFAASSPGIDQLELSVTAGSDVVVSPVRRPTTAGAPLASPQSVSIFLADAFADTDVTCTAVGYAAGVAIARGSAPALLARRRLVPVQIDLAAIATGDASVDDGGALDADASMDASTDSDDTTDASATTDASEAGATDGPAVEAGPKANGAACLSGGECDSALCVDGVCCGSVCGTCAACNLKGFEGMCAPIVAGTPSTKCADQGSVTCGFDGTCNGSGACRKYAAGMPCKAASCPTTSTFMPASACDGQGACVAPASVSCAPYLCDASAGTPACRSTCQAGVVGCVSPALCTNGSCGAKVLKANGDGCVAAGDCTSNHCVDGVCCATVCTGACVACNLSGFGGTCHNVDLGKTDPHKVCADGGSTSCKQTGLCNGAGACALYAATTTCVAATCAARMVVNARKCDGAGTCMSATSTDCAPYRCDTATTACFTSCVTNAQCANAPKKTCNNMICQ